MRLGSKLSQLEMRFLHCWEKRMATIITVITISFAVYHTQCDCPFVAISDLRRGDDDTLKVSALIYSLGVMSLS